MTVMRCSLAAALLAAPAALLAQPPARVAVRAENPTALERRDETLALLGPWWEGTPCDVPAAADDAS